MEYFLWERAFPTKHILTDSLQASGFNTLLFSLTGDQKDDRNSIMIYAVLHGSLLKKIPTEYGIFEFPLSNHIGSPGRPAS